MADKIQKAYEAYSGTILDVPVGTAIFTAKKWAAPTRTKITCLDYSKDMIEQAENRLGKYEHIFWFKGMLRMGGWPDFNVLN